MCVSDQKQVLGITGVKTAFDKAVKFLDVPGTVFFILYKNLGLEIFPVVLHGLDQVDVLPLGRGCEILAFIGYAARKQPAPFISGR